MATLAGVRGAPPPVVHVRDILPSGAVAALARRALDRRAAVNVAVSAYAARGFGRSRTSSPVVLIPNAVDLSRFDANKVTKQAARAALGWSQSDLILGMVAQITPWKAQEDAIQILSLLSNAVPRARLVLVGEAKFVAVSTRYDNLAYERRLHRLIDGLDLRDRILLLGERSDVPELLRGLDFLLVPSWSEPFGRSVIEAMAMGTPVVATDVGGPAEIIEDGLTGTLLPPRRPEAWAHALRRLVGDGQATQQMCAAARAKVQEHYGAKAHAASMVSLYRQLLAGEAASDASERGLEALKR